MTRRLLVEIEAEAETCGDCPHAKRYGDGNPMCVDCAVYGDTHENLWNGRRHPLCIEAEQRALDLGRED